MPSLHSALFLRGAYVNDTCDLEERAKTYKLCIALLDKYSCHSDRRGVRDRYALQAELVKQVIVNITDVLIREGTFARSALYQAIGEQDVFLVACGIKSNRCSRCCAGCPYFSIAGSQYKYYQFEILSNILSAGRSSAETAASSPSTASRCFMSRS